ncbi:acetolactate synthase large subunit [Pseudaestuariivita atlantica]|uniref:Decarboxylase n=1 Tax=Pseudaestuariivita atlantica TaxID=1317121 RepID=A0A0L1JPD9_9RHOB|nr:acetolactate synthase large subunit [Pseudaestuariivita atlantica]KNG93629.1 hypothetical protein ATO11_10495 [Pseudaestuariivita atlantica]
MNGAESLVETFLENDVTVCFANPGTSEMHFVAALDQHPDMRCVLCLFEGGTSGAADGYFRMSGKVAATMLHLAPGFGNAFANLHNARKAGSGILNVMGEHATYHLAYDSPLRGDTAGISHAISDWTRTSATAADVAGDGAAGIAAARAGNGRIATLILPADTAWGEGSAPAIASATEDGDLPSEAELETVADALGRPGAALFLGGIATYGPELEAAGRIAKATGCRLIAPLFTARVRRGAGQVVLDQLPYRGELAAEVLADLHTLVCIGTPPPVNFFAYPGQPSVPTPDTCAVIDLCGRDGNVTGTLAALEKRVGAAGSEPDRRAFDLPEVAPDADLTAETACATIIRWMPEETIVVNEAVTSGLTFGPQSRTARPHDFLTTVGGAIGCCLPTAVGSAIACPDRKVLALTGDGSAMYTIQSLWTMARENLDVTVVVFNNGAYRILHHELEALGVAQVGRNARAMFDLTGPELDWMALARGHGLDAVRADSLAELNAALAHADDVAGPCLIEVVL